ncbi:MAG TPA: hypothetical protein VIK91_14450 [Nannocystis sp.]
MLAPGLQVTVTLSPRAVRLLREVARIDAMAARLRAEYVALDGRAAREVASTLNGLAWSRDLLMSHVLPDVGEQLVQAAVAQELGEGAGDVDRAA